MPERISQAPEAEHRQVKRTYIYPYTLRTSERIIGELNTLLSSKAPDGADVDVIGVCMGVKSAGSVMAPGMLAPLSVPNSNGAISNPEEVLKELNKKTTLYMVPQHPLFGENERIHRGGRFEYRLSRESGNDTQHTVDIMSVPAVSPRILQGHILNPVDRKFADLITIPLTKFGEAINQGSYQDEDNTWDILESSTFLAPVDGSAVTMSDLQRDERDTQLTEMLGFCIDMDVQYKHAIAFRISQATALEPVTVDGNISLIDTYKSLIARRGSRYAEELIRNTINSMHVDIYATWFRHSEHDALVPTPHSEEQNDDLTKVASRLRTSLRTGNLGTDILHLLPIRVQTGLSEGYSTKAVADFETFWEDVYKGSLAGTYIDFATVMTSRDPATTEIRGEYVEAAHKASLQKIAEVFKYDLRYVENCWIDSLEVVPEMGDGFKRADEDIRASLGLKEHELKNEVHNADIPELYYMYKHAADTRLRFEAGRQLMVFLHELVTAETYVEARRDQNRLFSNIIDDYFGPDEEWTTIGGREVPTRKSITTERLFVVDERIAKPRLSFSRKTWSRPPDGSAKDIFAYSLILDHTQIGDDQDPQETVMSEIDQLVTYMQNAYGEHYDVSLNPLKKSGLVHYGAYLSETDPAKKAALAERLKGGTNAGSNADGIVRVKTAIALTHRISGKQQTCEFSVYPYTDLPREAIESGFMGWTETLDTHREYEVRRMIEPLKGAPGTRSLYDLFFPASFYPTTHEARGVAAKKY